VDRGIDSAREIREYFIPDFSNWKDHDAYQKAFERLLRDLKAEARVWRLHRGQQSPALWWESPAGTGTFPATIGERPSPRTWGKRGAELIVRDLVRTIPTRVGKTVTDHHVRRDHDACIPHGRPASESHHQLPYEYSVLHALSDLRGLHVHLA
jgi:hypothetical protein